MSNCLLAIGKHVPQNRTKFELQTKTSGGCPLQPTYLVAENQVVNLELIFDHVICKAKCENLPYSATEIIRKQGNLLVVLTKSNPSAPQ